MSRRFWRHKFCAALGQREAIPSPIQISSPLLMSVQEGKNGSSLITAHCSLFFWAASGGAVLPSGKAPGSRAAGRTHPLRSCLVGAASKCGDHSLGIRIPTFGAWVLQILFRDPVNFFKAMGTFRTLILVNRHVGYLHFFKAVTGGKGLENLLLPVTARCFSVTRHRSLITVFTALA